MAASLLPAIHGRNIGGSGCTVAKAIALAVAEVAELPMDPHLNTITAVIQNLTARGDTDRYRGTMNRVA